MADLDDELLALAGDDSGEHTENAQSPPLASPSLSPAISSRSPLPTTEKPVTPPPARRGTAQKKTKAKMSAKKRTPDESEAEEGEVLVPLLKKVLKRGVAHKLTTKHRALRASTPRSLGSDAMDESSDENEPEPDAPADEDDDDGPLYPLEGRFKNETDKAYILSLPEVEREEIFYRRETEMLRRQQTLQLRQKLQEHERVKERLDGRSKRKAGDADLDDDSRRAVRPKTEREKAMEDLKRSRANKTKDNLRRDAARPSRRSRSRSAGSSEKDAEGESEVEWDDRARKAPREQPLAQLPDIEQVRMGRSRLANYCFYPGFEEVVTGSFARVNVGNAGQGPVYRLALIKGLREGKPYRMEGPQGKPLMTDMHLLLTFGRAERTMPFITCSDSPLTDAEYENWRRTMEDEAVRIPTKSSLQQKRKDYISMRDRSWTNLEIDAKIKRQNRLAHLLQKNESIVTATALMTETHGDKLAALNELNRKRNREEVRAAQLAEERKRMSAFKAAIAKKKAEAEAKNSLSVPKKEHDDLFSDMSDISRTGSPAPGAAPKPKTVRETKNGIPTFTRPKMDDEIIGALDLEIDLEV